MNKDFRKDWLDFEQFKEKFQRVPVEEYPNNVLNAVPNPKVSVRVTTYQHVNYIRDTIEGVLMQKTDFPIEVIIGDDESTDGTREICKEYAEKYPDLIRLMLHKRENNIKILDKPCGIFQIGYNLYMCRGKYVAGCSGDDYWNDSKKLQKQFDFLETNKGFSLVYGDWVKKSFDKSEGCYYEKEVKASYPKASTMMYRNVFGKIPSQFFNVIQEDVFKWFVLSNYGKFKKITNFNPTYINDVENGVGRFTSEESEKHFIHSLNVRRMIFHCFKNTQFKNKAAYFYLSTIRNSFKRAFQRKIKLLNILTLISLIVKDGLLKNFIYIGWLYFVSPSEFKELKK